jgi:hypothetical protein
MLVFDGRAPERMGAIRGGAVLSRIEEAGVNEEEIAGVELDRSQDAVREGPRGTREAAHVGPL